MIEKILNPMVEFGGKALIKGGEVLAKEGIKQGAKIAAKIASYLIVSIISACLTSNYKDKVNKKLN